MGRHSGDFLVRPLDSLWLRGPRPFVAGENSADAACFPPSPWTFQGIVRSRLLLAALPGDLDTADRDAIARLVGPPDRLPEGWRLEGGFPAQHTEQGRLQPWFPAPRLLLVPEHPTARQPVRARAAPQLASLSDLPAGRVLFGSPREARRPAEPIGGWVSAPNLLWALSGAGSWEPRGHRRDLPPCIEPEVRSGVKIDRHTATAADHLLYSATHHRFAPDSGLLGRLTAVSDRRLPDDALWQGWGQAGRKGRLVEFQGPVDVDEPWERLRSGSHLLPRHAAIPDPVFAWIVLLTPDLFVEHGPHFSTPSSAVRVRVLGHLTGPGPDLGGFDRVGGGGRPVQATWAAGSAWLLELSGGSEEERLAAGRALQGLDAGLLDARKLMGFGQRVVGLVNPDTFLPISGGVDG